MRIQSRSDESASVIPRRGPATIDETPGDEHAPALPQCRTTRPGLLARIALPLTLTGLLAPASAQSLESADEGVAASNVVYVCSNDSTPGQNGIFAFRRNPSDGGLTPLPGSPFLTGGTGDLNPNGALGPSDHDQEVVVSADKRFLFTTNPGSNTIAVMRIRAEGSLRTVAGSPFKSGGIQPISLGLAGDRLYVVNKNQDANQVSSLELPNTTGFRVLPDGSLDPIPSSTVCLTAGSSPTQALISGDRAYLFGADLFSVQWDNGPGAPPFASFLQSYRLDATGRLEQRTPQLAPVQGGPPLVLGLQIHPTEPILYAGLVARNELAVYTIDTAGLLTFFTAVPNSGLALCWILVDARGEHLYTTNTFDSTVSTYSLTDPYVPMETQALILKERGVMTSMLPNLYSSSPYQLAISPDGAHVYIVSQRVTLDPLVTEGNFVHILDVQPDGTLVETLDPLPLPGPFQARPHGIVVL